MAAWQPLFLPNSSSLEPRKSTWLISRNPNKGFTAVRTPLAVMLSPLSSPRGGGVTPPEFAPVATRHGPPSIPLPRLPPSASSTRSFSPESSVPRPGHKPRGIRTRPSRTLSAPRLLGAGRHRVQLPGPTWALTLRRELHTGASARPRAIRLESPPVVAFRVMPAMVPNRGGLLLTINHLRWNPSGKTQTKTQVSHTNHMSLRAESFGAHFARKHENRHWAANGHRAPPNTWDARSRNAFYPNNKVHLQTGLRSEQPRDHTQPLLVSLSQVFGAAATPVQL